MKNTILTLIAICSFIISNAQSKKEIIQELTIENTNLKEEISVLNNKIQVLEDENITLNKDILTLKKELFVDKVQTPQEYGKTLFDLFVSQRLAKYPELQFQLKDTMYLKVKDVETMKEFIKKTQKNLLDFYLEGLNKGLDWSLVKFEKFDFEINEPNGDIDINHLEGKFYFNYSGNRYSFKNKASILENGKWRGYVFKTLVNETLKIEKEKKEEQEKLKEPYIPRGVKFGGVVYSYNSKEVNPKTMYGLTIPIENNTPYAIDWIKFQFRIYENGKLILSKNIIIGEYSSGFDSKLEPGEKEIVEINDIGEVFIGSGLKNDKWSYDVELLEVKPKQFED
jgi:hypothetical protein